ncbi:MAG: T9SS type A sorting domain-containing protein [Flavobacteriia bacterium]|jgi:hypothetical protein|nr:T9SS type A sorting domain-containing protein [Cryomorphaceae bacterium]
MRYYYYCIFALLLHAQSCIGQANTMSSGGDCTGAGGSASYSVGQIDYIAIDVAAGSAYQGVQQPYELFSLSTVDENSDFTLVLGPNPTAGELTLISSSALPLNSYYVLFDEAGKTLMTRPILNEISSINIDSYAAGIYCLQVYSVYAYSDKKILHTFKIIKTQ